jgi:hypothetical protein
MSTSTRIYKVLPPPGSEAPPRFIRAASKLQAIKALVKGYAVETATMDDLVQHMEHGAKVEDAA